MAQIQPAMIHCPGINLGAVQILRGHIKIENTVRCPGVDVEDPLILAERTEI